MGLRSAYVGLTLGLPWVMSLAIPGRFWVILAESPVKRRDRRCVFYEMIDFPIRKRHFLVWWSVGGPWEPPGRKKDETKCSYSRPYRAKKKCEHFSSPEKKTFLLRSQWAATFTALLARHGPGGDRTFERRRVRTDRKTARVFLLLLTGGSEPTEKPPVSEISGNIRKFVQNV